MSPATIGRRPLKQSEAVRQVVATATALVAALDEAGAVGPVATHHHSLAAALAEYGQARARNEAPESAPADPAAALTDARGYKRPPQNRPGHGQGRVPANRGRLYPPDPPTVTEIFMLLQACPDTPHGRRLKALIPFTWRTGLRISEVLSIHESDLNPAADKVTVRRGKGGKRRIVGMDPFGWGQLEPWLEERREYPPGPVFCVLSGPTVGRAWAYPDVAKQLRQLGKDAGIRKRIAAHQLRHAHAVDLVREGKRLDLIQRQLGHADLGITTTYLMSITAEEVVSMSSDRPAPTLSVPDLMSLLAATPAGADRAKGRGAKGAGKVGSRV